MYQQKPIVDLLDFSTERDNNEIINNHTSIIVSNTGLSN